MQQQSGGFHDQNHNQGSQALPQTPEAQEQGTPLELSQEDGTKGQMTQPDKWDEIARALCYMIRSNYIEQDVGSVSAALRSAYAEGKSDGLKMAAEKARAMKDQADVAIAGNRDKGLPDFFVQLTRFLCSTYQISLFNQTDGTFQKPLLK